MSQKKRETRTHRHVLYEASVQSVESDIEFFERVFRNRNARPLRRLREDFCGTAALACTFVKRNADNRAWGVDIHGPTLEWGRRHHASRLGPAEKRLTLLQRDVRAVREPAVELVAALNFSYMTFKTRDLLRGYFEAVRASLAPGGMLVMDVFGGTESACELKERRRIPASKGPAGEDVPSFVYIWEQTHFNAIDHHLRACIHFMLPDGTRINRAFRYDWRLWTLPELQELLLEAGFAKAEAYLEGWEEDGEDTDGIFRRRKYYDNEAAWIAYMVGLT